MGKLFSFMISIMLAVCLVGCGNDSSTELDQEELVYHYERLSCMDEIRGEVMHFSASGDELYICSGEYSNPEASDEVMAEDLTGMNFYKCKTDGSNLTKLPIQWDVDSFEWLHSMEAAGPGELWLIVSSYSEESMINTYMLRKVSEDGSVLKEVNLNDYFDLEEFYIFDIEVDGNDNLYINTGYGVLILDDEGALSGVVEEDDLIENLLRVRDGSVLAGFAYEDGYTLKKIDPKEAAFCETYRTKLPYYDITVDMGGALYDFYYRSGESWYGYDLATGEQTEILHFTASGINTNNLGKLQVLSDETILAMYGAEGEDTTSEIYLLRKKDPKEVKARKIVTYASRYPDEEVKKQALAFNQSQDKYLVVVKDYQNSENPEMDLYKDLMSGEVIDLVDLSGMASDKYIAQGMFEDLYKFMKRDKEIRKEDFAEHMLAILETDGKLYHISPTVGMNAVVAKASDVTEGKALTFGELAEMEKDGAKGFYRETKSSMLSNVLEMNYDSYIDWIGGSCYFTGEDFISALEYANTYADDDVDLWEKYPESVTEKIRSGEIFFLAHYAISPADLQFYEKQYEEEIAMTGFPSGRYSGAAMSLNRDFAICAASSDKKGAWAFLKTFLSREYVYGDPEDTISVPIRKDSLEDRIKAYMTKENYTDEFGNQVSPMSYEWYYDEIEIQVKSMSKKHETLYRDVIQNMDHKYVYDHEVNTIVQEEAEPYFDGEISSREAAENIQKRVSVYMADYKEE